jgi:gamma-glutamyltranspeptidase
MLRSGTCTHAREAQLGSSFPRIHHQYQPDRVDAEPAALIYDVAERLQAIGHKLNPKLRSQGDVHAIMVEEATGWRLGWSDGPPRRSRGGLLAVP